MARQKTLVLAALSGLLLWALPRALADNAGFALAPADASLALDARDLPSLLPASGNAAVRSLLESVAGSEALATFDLLASRERTGPDAVAREIFGGRVAFFVASDAEGAGEARPSGSTPGSTSGSTSGPNPGSWMLGIESDDARCARVLRLLGARLVEPGRYEAPRERLRMRRVGGWLLVAPSGTSASAFDGAAARVADEAADGSLLGEPLVQGLLDSDAPLRVFLRHDLPVGGASSLAIRPSGGGLRIELDGRYDDPPGLLGEGKAPLDQQVVRAFEDNAALVIASPATGRVGASDAFWLALIPELAPSPALRANLSGDRLLAIGACKTHPMPSLAFAWRVEDAEQARVDQDLFMRSVCCGIVRAVRPVPTSPDLKAVAIAEEDSAADRMHREEVDATEPRKLADLGPFLERYLGAPLKLGPSVLCWETVTTPCGGWQVYASDVEWLGEVAKRLAAASCGGEERTASTGVGFCDGPRAAILIRRWRPFASDDPADRVSRGLDAIAGTFERFGRIRFRYERPSLNRVRATIELEQPGMLAPKPAAPPAPAR